MGDEYSITQNITKHIVDRLNIKLEEYLVEGLKRKGFEFKNNVELEYFIITRCKCHDNIPHKEKIYYVDDVPFFLHKYEVQVNLNPISENGSVFMNANYGSFAYL